MTSINDRRPWKKQIAIAMANPGRQKFAKAGPNQRHQDQFAGCRDGLAGHEERYGSIGQTAGRTYSGSAHLTLIG